MEARVSPLPPDLARTQIALHRLYIAAIDAATTAAEQKTKQEADPQANGSTSISQEAPEDGRRSIYQL